MLASIIQTNPLQKGARDMGNPFSVEADRMRAMESLVTQLTTV
jgi:hypothetical protein